MKKFYLKEEPIVLQTKLGLVQTFSYNKGSVGLNFQIKLDDGGKELKDFRECLLKAVDDVNKILKEI